MAAIALAIINSTLRYPTLLVEVRNDAGPLEKDELVDVLKEKDIAKEVIKILKENIAPRNQLWNY